MNEKTDAPIIIFYERCTNCLIEYSEDHFISFKQSRKPTKTCYTCRLKMISTTLKHKEHYDNVKRNLPPCVVCGDDDPSHKDFDHLEDKISEVNKMTTIEKIDSEVQKCQVLCMKCHRKKTKDEIDTKKTLRVQVRNKTADKARKIRQRNYAYRCKRKLEIGGCQNPVCTDIFDPENLMFYEFDHIDRNSKYKCVSHCYGSIENLEKEIQKCRLFCGYCHRKHTRQQFINTRKQIVNNSTLRPKQRKKRVTLSYKQVQEIRQKYATGNYTHRDLVIEYNSSRTRISDIINMKSRLDK